MYTTRVADMDTDPRTRDLFLDPDSFPDPRGIYSVFFFIEPKVFVNLTYLYLSEINNQGLIFFVLLGHLIIRSNK